MPNHTCQAGKTEYGSPYWVTTSKNPKTEKEYQDYQCRHSDCSQNIPIQTGNTR